MNRIACLLVSAFLLSGGAAFAQGELDAYRYSQTDLNGTARYLSMGGALVHWGGIFLQCLPIRPAWESIVARK